MGHYKLILTHMPMRKEHHLTKQALQEELNYKPIYGKSSIAKKLNNKSKNQIIYLRM